MRHTLTKFFYFSTSVARDGRVFGYNYKLGVTVDGLEQNEEDRFEEMIQRSLINQIHSRDLGMDVDFLKEKTLSDKTLLEAFGEIIQKTVAPLNLRSLTLERDERTVSTLTFLPTFQEKSDDA